MVKWLFHDKVGGGRWAGRRRTGRGLASRFKLIPYQIGLTTYLTLFKPGFFSLPVTGGVGGGGGGAPKAPLSIASKPLMLQSYGHQKCKGQCNYHLQLLGTT